MCRSRSIAASCSGLLGPNGAGKTTTVSMIAGLVTPDKGEVLVGGARLRGDTDPKKRNIGLVPQDLALYDELLGAREPAVLRRALQPLGRRARQGDRVGAWTWSASPIA